MNQTSTFKNPKIVSETLVIFDKILKFKCTYTFFPMNSFIYLFILIVYSFICFYISCALKNKKTLGKILEKLSTFLVLTVKASGSPMQI